MTYICFFALHTCAQNWGRKAIVPHFSDNEISEVEDDAKVKESQSRNDETQFDNKVQQRHMEIEQKDTEVKPGYITYSSLSI